MLPKMPIELLYVEAVVRDRIRRLRRMDEEDRDRGLNTLETVVLAAIIVPCAVALALFIVSKVKSYQAKIK